jgi:hypothetical protein
MHRRVLAAVLGLVLGCVTEEKVERRIEDANYCDAVDECVAVSPGCPLGCVRLINRAEEAEIQALIDRYHRTHRDDCAYDCEGIGEVRCEDGRCVADPP